ncbi:MAG TPA: DNA mismatch endonuclease Vsr [Candidatus Angelobacter sp.]
MADNLSKQLRSKVMRAIRSKNTKPELTVRKLIFSLGYFYRLKRPRLPGRPDLIFAPRRKVIFVHGCFWHVHTNCAIAHIPKYPFWREKLKTNKARDAAAIKALNKAGWSTLVIWECELKNSRWVRERLIEFLGPRSFRR